VISHPESRVGLYVVPTDEELMIARHTVAVLTDHAPARAASVAP
jgi:acetate kinase